MTCLLDTNVVSQYTKKPFHPLVNEWIRHVDDRDLYLCEVTFAELWFGVERLEQGKRRTELERWIENDLTAKFAGRVLRFDLRVARSYGWLMARSRSRGFSPSAMDTLIAATAVANGMVVATLNRSDFEQLGVELVEF